MAVFPISCSVDIRPPAENATVAVSGTAWSLNLALMIWHPDLQHYETLMANKLARREVEAFNYNARKSFLLAENLVDDTLAAEQAYNGTAALHYTTIREDIWMKALAGAGMPHRAMYSLRHTFVGWMVLLGVDSARLKNLAGHSSRSSLSEDTYGDFREGLLSEKEHILEHLGRDILEPEEFKRSFPHLFLQENCIDVKKQSTENGMSHEVIKELACLVASEIKDAQLDTFSYKGLSMIFSSNSADNYSGRLAS